MHFIESYTLPMYEIIKKQFENGRSLALLKYNSSVKRESRPDFDNDLYPINQDYFHELNPFFLCNLNPKELFSFTNVFTVRDGHITFADFLLNNFSNLQNLGPELFIIHPDLVPLIPDNIKNYFATWWTVQKEQTNLKAASKIIVTGIICEHTISNLDTLKLKLQKLKQIDPEASVELYLPIRRDMFYKKYKENVLIHQVMKCLSEILPDKDFKLLTTSNFFEIGNFKNTYVIDLAQDNFLVADNFLHYYVQARGGTVEASSLTSPPRDSFFSFDLSLYHELHITPLNQEKNVFMELLMYKKQNPHVKEYLYEPTFHNLLRELLKKES